MSNKTPDAIHRTSAPTAEYSEHGLRAQPDTLQLLVQDAMDRLPVGPYRSETSRDLTRVEQRILTEAGMDLRARDLGLSDPLSRSTAAYVALLDACFTVKEVAERLDVTTARVRQLLTGQPRRLVGIRGRSEWRIPAFQFTHTGIIPGWDEVVPHLDPELHPVSVLHFATRPHTDLVVGTEEVSVAPLDWLIAGRDPGEVAALAAHL